MDYAKESLRLHEQWAGQIEITVRSPVENCHASHSRQARLIPYRAVGVECGMLLALRTRGVAVDGKPRGKLLVLNERSWCSLAADPMEYAGFSAWFGVEDQAALDRMEIYYRLNPEKVPDYIFLSKNSLFEDPDAILEAARARGYTLTESEFSYYLERK